MNIVALVISIIALAISMFSLAISLGVYVRTINIDLWRREAERIKEEERSRKEMEKEI